MGAAVFREILLVIFFRAIKGRGGFDLGHDRTAETSAFFECREFGFGRGFLFRRVVKNHGAILRTDIRPLAIASRRIVVTPEDIKERVIGDFRRIKSDLNDFGMAGFVATNILVGRIFRLSSSIAGDGVFHSAGLSKDCLDPPETSRAKSGFLSAHSAR
jgi:hypothetical protein